MSWWHDDIDVWAGSDGTDLHKAYVDLINAAHERYLFIGGYDDVDEGPFGTPIGTPLLTLVCNTNREPSQPPVYGTKAAPLDYEDVLGIPLNEFYHKCVISATNAISRLVSRGGPNLFAHAWQAGWAKSSDWGGQSDDWDGVWYGDSIEEEIGTVTESAPEFFVFGGPSSILHVAGVFKYYRRLIELMRWPLLAFNVESGMTEEDDWLYGGISSNCPTPPYDPDPPPPPPLPPVGTIETLALKTYYRPFMGYNWRGAFVGDRKRDQCPLIARTVTPAEVFENVHFHGAYDEDEAHRAGPPMSLSKVLYGPNVSAWEWRMIFIPPEFRGPPFYRDRGWVVHSDHYTCSCRGQQEIKVKTTPSREYGNGTVLKEFMYFSVQERDCAVVSWDVGDTTITEDRMHDDGGVSGSNYQGYYEVPGTTNLHAPAVTTIKHTEGMDENPFTGVFDQWNTYNSNDTVYIKRIRTVVPNSGSLGIANKSIHVNGRFYQAFVLADGGFEYV